MKNICCIKIKRFDQSVNKKSPQKLLNYMKELTYGLLS